MSAWLTLARTRIDAGLTTSTIGMPLRTSSPSWTSAMLFDFQIERSTAMPPIGDLIAIRSALLSACCIAFSARSRRIWRMRRSASAAAALQVVGRLELLELGLGFLERLRVLLGLDLRQHLVLDDLELRAPERALRLHELAVVLGPRRAVLGLLLPDLLFEIVQLDASVERVLRADPGDRTRRPGRRRAPCCPGGRAW